ncbi:pyruvate/2-oxoglutarate dehydrogenase complex dihydrolipoamide acyltransferase (E2) component [Pseudomonas sp. JAI111]|uniref:lipoyl domain-containing protein n=1 Tax=Pseudomonas sp. JAI111 TaxID=2735913 RepID=UPI0021676533|nr:lipoyl domain-containing protein [Pseudomonas sp. JAI111]MCS3835711.1 pyruvate/2-oxoglutarate dehydrogenase complex dihydrolipoamide acyltransferase (E2) component [Pseudomonas sp. JAI111]
MTDLKIPTAGDAVSELQLVEWIAENGAHINEGDVLYSIESDKSVLDVESPASGKLVILERAGEIFPIGHLVGRIESRWPHSVAGMHRDTLPAVVQGAICNLFAWVEVA